MKPPTKSSEYLYKMATGKTEWGNRQRGSKREREEQIKGVRDGALERFGNSVGWKCPLGKGHPSISNKSDK
jgi:hypothetical protein